jgi:hypothetical protein
MYIVTSPFEYFIRLSEKVTCDAIYLGIYKYIFSEESNQDNFNEGHGRLLWMFGSAHDSPVHLVYT